MRTHHASQLEGMRLWICVSLPFWCEADIIAENNFGGGENHATKQAVRNRVKSIPTVSAEHVTESKYEC